jgi:hypothetical protein
MAVTEQQFSWGLMAWKAAITFGKTSVSAGLAAAIVLEMANVPLPSTLEEFTAKWPIFVAPVVLGIVKAVMNWNKNKGGAT